MGEGETDDTVMRTIIVIVLIVIALLGLLAMVWKYAKNALP